MEKNDEWNAQHVSLVKEMIHTFNKYFDDIDTICYIRNPYDWFISAWQHRLIYDSYSTKKIRYSNQIDFYNSVAHHFDYREVLTPYSDYTNLILKRYDEVKSELIVDFVKLISIANSRYCYPKNWVINKKENVPLSIKAISFKCLYLNHFRYKPLVETLIYFLYKNDETYSNIQYRPNKDVIQLLEYKIKSNEDFLPLEFTKAWVPDYCGTKFSLLLKKDLVEFKSNYLKRIISINGFLYLIVRMVKYYLRNSTIFNSIRFRLK